MSSSGSNTPFGQHLDFMNSLSERAHYATTAYDRGGGAYLNVPPGGVGSRAAGSMDARGAQSDSDDEGSAAANSADEDEDSEGDSFESR